MMSERVFHVVCRDCSVESIRYSEADAEDAAASHVELTDHRVSVGRVE